MKISKFLLTGLMVITSALLFGQTKTVTGTITSEDSGETLPGATVVVEGTTNGAVSDINGKYSLETEVGKTLVVSFIGMQDRNITVGSADVYNVALKTGINLDEFVVTALGVTRDKKSLGYSTQEVSGDEVSQVTTDNFVNNLSGKVAGVQIKQSGNIGGSSNVVIRGFTSVTGDNQALFVVDGVPLNNQNVNTDYQSRGGKGYDYGNAISDIDPNNIESITVLKGAAAALYGSRAANGVIMITTKKGKAMTGGKKIGVTVNSTAQLGWADRSTFIEYQDKYGAGYGPGFYEQYDINGDGINDKVVQFKDDASFGSAFDPNLMVYGWDSFDAESPYYKQARPWVAAENGPYTFFETQQSYDNNISLYGGDDKGTFRLNYGRLDQKGILPNSKITRNNLNIRGTMNLSDKLTISGSANYINTEGIGRNSTGYSGNIMSNFRQWWETNVDIQEQRDAYETTGRNVSWNPKSPTNVTPLYWDNPYWQRNENYTSDRRDHIYGFAKADYKIADWFTITGQASIDQYALLIEERLAVGSLAQPFGVGLNSVPSGYTRKNINASELNLDLYGQFNKDLSEDFNLSALIGTNIRRNTYNRVNMNTSGGLVVPNVYALSNSVNATLESEENAYEKGVNGVYASASLGYKRFLYLDASVRNDVSSTLPTDNNSYIYPSVSGSFVFSELMEKNNWLDFGKIRLNYAEVGSDALTHSLKETYTANVPYNSPLYSVPNTRQNPDLRPERTKSFEAGLNMEFYKSRFGFDVTYYNSKTIDGIIPVSVSRASGYSSFYVNAAEVQNKGVELQVNGTPVQTENFAWNINVNFTKNESEVLSLYNDVQNIVLGSYQGGITTNATVGQPYGTIQGTDHKYLNGEPVVSSAGYYVVPNATNNILGSITPDFLMGITNTLTYRTWSLGFLIDWQQGGQVFSLDQWYGLPSGLYPETAANNDLGNPIRSDVADGGGYIVKGVTANGEANTNRVAGDDGAIWGYATSPNSDYVYDATAIRLREASLTYRMPAAMLQNTFLGGVSFSLTGHNLWIIDKKLPYADPEAGQGSGNRQGWQSGVLPTVRSISFSVKLDF